MTKLSKNPETAKAIKAMNKRIDAVAMDLLRAANGDVNRAAKMLLEKMREKRPGRRSEMLEVYRRAIATRLTIIAEKE